MYEEAYHCTYVCLLCDLNFHLFIFSFCVRQSPTQGSVIATRSPTMSPILELEPTDTLTPESIGQTPERTKTEVEIVAKIVDSVLGALAEDLTSSSSEYTPSRISDDCKRFEEAAQILNNLVKQQIAVLYPGQEVDPINKKNVVSEAFRVLAGQEITYQNANGTHMGLY